ncbi:MAG: flagellar basal body P-ring protein FlgI [Rubrivivax sp.]|nr:MAG: flagellar basal body P-ring protein FlgI [Rubrivivax sp.]
MTHRPSLSKLLISTAFAAATAALCFPIESQAVRLKEIAAVQGVRTNQVMGYGLIVGLDGTGDQTTQTPFTVQSLNAMLQQMGVTVPPGASMQLKNVAAVLVTANLPPFSQPGQPIDVNVSSLGNAKSLRGGTLIATPLKGADGQIYAMAQGNVVIGGAGASQGGSKVQINHLSAGRIPAGATVERSVPTPWLQGNALALGLESDDFNTARDVANAINKAKGPGTAEAIDGRTVSVRLPQQPGERVAFMGDIENLKIDQATPAARIVVNARTGSIVINQAVTIGPCAVAHGNLSVTISSTPVISQPSPLSQGQTVVTQKADIRINQEPGSLIQLPAGTQLTEPFDGPALARQPAWRGVERRDQVGHQGSRQAARIAVHAGADEVHALDHDGQRHAGQRRHRDGHQHARHAAGRPDDRPARRPGRHDPQAAGTPGRQGRRQR